MISHTQKVVAAVVMALGVLIGVSAPAMAVDNYGITKVCTASDGTKYTMYANFDATAGGDGAVLDYWELRTTDSQPGMYQQIQYYVGGWGSTASINMSHSGPNFVGGPYSDGHYTWHHDVAKNNVRGVELTVELFTFSTCAKYFSPPLS